MTLLQSEAAKWVKAKQQPMAEYNQKVNGTLSDSAASGFYQPPGNVIEDILNAGQITKLELTDRNAGLYKEQQNIAFQIAEFALKLALEYSKLELAIYKKEIIDAITLEHAQMEHDFKLQQADIARLKAENNARSVILIKAEADQKAQITDYKIRQEEAKRLGLEKELELLEAQKETALERLKIIDALKLVIAAEELIVEAERRKAEALALVIEVERILLGIKEEMIPLYEVLAGHKKNLAGAITAEAAAKAAIARLGYDWIDVKQAEADSFLSQKGAELALEYARTAYVRASTANDETRADGSVTVADAKNNATDTVITTMEAVKKSIIDVRLDTQLARFLQDIENKISIQTAQTEAIAERVTAQLASMDAIAISQGERIEACATTSSETTLCKHVHHYVNSD